MASPIQAQSGDWDPSQFKLQSDGTFRISIRGMAAMAGIDFSGLARSLKTAVDENPLPCARSLVSQGFNPVDVSTWGETGGIPEDAAPFILEHYGITAASPSQQARAVLLAFSRVGINAYLKERLGVPQNSAVRPVPQLTDTQRNLEWLMDFTTRWNIRLDERDMLHIKETATMAALPPGGGSQKVFNDYPVSRLVQDLFGVVLKNKQYQQIGRGLAAMWRRETSSEPAKHDQYVDGACRSVAHYPREWAVPALKQLQKAHPDWFQRG